MTDLPSKAGELFQFLCGEWTMSRAMVNIGVVEGRARFSVFGPNTLLYEEAGMLALDSGFSGEVFRRYYYQREDNEIVVSFVDAPPGVRIFIRLCPQLENGGVWARGKHFCECDVYDCRYTFELPYRFRVDTTVSGPEKEYLMSTLFERS